MNPYWLDSDVLIQAKNAYYAFDIVPGFWTSIASSVDSGFIQSPMMVYDEIMRGGDELTEWAKGMISHSLFKDADKDVQTWVSKVADHVHGTYDEANAKVFLEAADPWVISAAIASGGTVVTHEVFGGYGCKKVKIPNVCQKFGVPTINCYEMLRKLGLRIG